MSLTRVSPALFQVSNNITSVTVGGSANTVSLTFDSNGVITGASNNALSVANTQITGLIEAAQIGSANATLVTSGTLPTARLPAGSVLQVKSTTLKSNVSTTSVTATNLTGMSVTITPTSASNKILIQASLNVSIGAQKRIYFTVTGGNAASYIGDAGTGQECAAAFCSRVNEDYIMGTTPLLYLDSPATTSAVTYQIQWWIETGSTAYLNRPVNLDANGANQASTITVMEIAG